MRSPLGGGGIKIQGRISSSRLAVCAALREADSFPYILFMVTSKNSIAVETTGIVSVIFSKKPREYTKYSLRFLLHLTKKSLAARLALNI